MNKTKFFLALCATAALTACGGGGDSGTADSTTSSTPTSFPVQQALANAYTHGLQQTLNVTGTASNGTTTYPVSGSLTFTLGAAASTTFNNAAALQSVATVNGQLTVNGQTAPLNSLATDYLNAQYAPIGSSAIGAYCVAATPGIYPTTATAGQNGDVVTYTCYTDSTKSTPIGTMKESYVTTVGSTNDALNIQLLTNVYNTSNQLVLTGSSTFKITSAGVPSLIGYATSGTDGGVTVSITAQ